MFGYFPVIVRIHLLAALVFITPSPDVNALSCPVSSESCDQRNCANKEADPSSSQELERCRFRSGMVAEGFNEMNKGFGPNLIKSLDGLEDAERQARAKEYLDLAQSLNPTLQSADDTNNDPSNAHCASVVFTGTAKVPGGKTLVRTAVVRNCMLGAPKCEEMSFESKQGNIDFKIKLCSRGRKIVASKVLLLAPVILMGITAFLAVPTTTPN